MSEITQCARVRYIHIIEPAPGGWKVRFRCCGTVHFRTDAQIRLVRVNLADQCTACRIKGLRAQPIKARGCSPC
jgi:hypothetical protein